MISRLVQSYRQAYAGVPRNVWLMSLVLLVSRSGTMVLPFLAIYSKQEMDFEPTMIGWLLSAYGVGGVIAGLLGGRLTQRIGAIPTQIIALTLSVPGYLFVGWATNFSTMVASLFYLSLAVECMRPACATATIDFCDDESQHTRALAVNRLAVNLGMTLGPAAGGFLALISYQLLFYANALSTFGALVLTLHFFGWHFHSNNKNGESESTGHSPSPFRDRPFLVFSLLNILAACVFFQFLGTYPLYLKEQYQMEEYHIGLLFAVNTIVIVAFELVLVHFVARWPLLRVYAWGQLLSCVGFGILPFAAGSSFGIGAVYCVFSMLVLTVGEMLAMPLGSAYAARRSTPANRGKYMGVFVTSFSIAALIAPLAGFWLYEQDPNLVWYSSLAVAVVVFFSLMILASLDGKNSPSSK